MRDNKIKRIQDKKMLVSILFIAEGDPQYSLNIFKNVRQQVYKNIEYIILYPLNFDINKFKELLFEQTDVDLSTPIIYKESINGEELFDDGLKEVAGEVIFLKTSSPVIWGKHHIISHLEKHQEKKFKNSIVLSNVETRNIAKSENDPTGTIGYRVSKKITAQELLVDEISFTKDYKISFKPFFSNVDNNGNVTKEESGKKAFDIAKLYSYITLNSRNIQFANEISVYVFIPDQTAVQNQNYTLTKPDWNALTTIQAIRDDEEMTTRHYLPTLFGNTQLDEQWNNKVRSMMNNYWNEIIKEEQKRIIIKRTVGMGDVIQTEPIIRYYKNLGFEVWYVTSDSRGCSDILKYFKSTPDKILKIPENRLLEDILGYNNLQKLLTENGYDPLNTEFDIRLDLDLAYESRNDTPFVNAYFQTIGLKQDEIENMNLKPEFEKYFENTPVGGEDYFAVNLSGSGWGGKEIGVEDAKHILEQLKLKNKKLYHTSSIPEKYKSLEYLFDKINKEDDFNEMINIIKHSNGFVGADNGTMHAAIGFNKKIMIWNGAALTKITTHYDNKIVIAKEALGCLGCKHKIFYEIVPISPTQQTITFVPNCRNNIAFECMNGFDKSYLEMQIEDFINLNKII